MGDARALLRGHPARAAGRVTRDEPGHAPGPMAFPPGADRRAIEGNVASGAVEAVQRRVLEHGLPSATHRARPLWGSGWPVAGSSAPSLVGITPQASQVVVPFERRYFLIHAYTPMVLRYLRKPQYQLPNGRDHLLYTVRPNGTYTLHFERPDRTMTDEGTIEAAGGEWTARSITGDTSRGQYEFPDEETLVTTTVLGSSTWLRVRR